METDLGVSEAGETGVVGAVDVVVLAGGDGVGSRGVGIFDANEDDLGNDDEDEAKAAGGEMGDAASRGLLLLRLAGEADLSLGVEEEEEEPFK